jgi:hypothetical protein
MNKNPRTKINSTYSTQNIFYLYVSIFIFLLTFFILLNTISTHDANKGVKVLSSVSDKFASGGTYLDSQTPIITSSKPSKAEFLEDNFVNGLETIFGEDFATKKSHAGGYNYINIVIPAKLFFDANNQLLPNSENMLMRISDLIRNHTNPDFVSLKIIYNIKFNQNRTKTIMERNKNLLYVTSISNLPKDLIQTSIVASDDEYVSFRFILKLTRDK